MNENKEIMAKNIRYYMDLNHVNATEVCKALDIKQNTFSDWINAKTYPRIDKIEKMARYFGISKAYLVEKPPTVDTPILFEATNRGLKVELSDLEYGLVVEYRKADDVDKRSVERILRLQEYFERLRGLKNGNS